MSEQKATIAEFLKIVYARLPAASQDSPIATLNPTTPDHKKTDGPSTQKQETKRTRSSTNSSDRPAPSVRGFLENNNTMSIWNKNDKDLEKYLRQEHTAGKPQQLTPPTPPVEEENA